MFCSKCGAQIADDAKFCDKCGNNVAGGATPSMANVNEPDNEVLFSVKPKFKLLYYCWGYFVWALIIIIVSSIAEGFGGFVGGLIFAVIVFVLCLISTIFKRLQLKNMKYDFYRTKVEYTDSFLNKAEKTVKYKNIRESVLSRTISDRIFGFGRVILHTSAETGYINGIVIPCLENSEEAYKKIKELIG